MTEFFWTRRFGPTWQAQTHGGMGTTTTIYSVSFRVARSHAAEPRFAIMLGAHVGAKVASEVFPANLSRIAGLAMFCIALCRALSCRLWPQLPRKHHMDLLLILHQIFRQEWISVRHRGGCTFSLVHHHHLNHT